MHVLILAAGSAGDVHPFVAIGRALRGRGHDVDVLANETFESLIRDAGLGFLRAGSAAEFKRATENPDLWHPRKGLKIVVNDAVVPSLEATVEKIACHRRDDTVLVASTLGFAARIMQERDGIPLATVHLAPCAFKTLHRMPRYGGMPCTERSPRWWKKVWWKMTDWATDPLIAPEVNRLRPGKAPVKSIFMVWLHSPDRCIGLWPEWFGPMQPDWPEQTRLTGFPLFDEADSRDVDPDLDAWLDAGDPPLVFTAGSANVTAQRFFVEAAATCKRLGRRGLLLTSRSPGALPDGVRWASYVPFSRLLPRCALLVSHGGIGTISQGIAAGIPQVVAALAFDQFDNGSRLEDLGVGTLLPMTRFRVKTAVPVLNRMLGDASVAAACARWRDRIEPALDDTVALIEALR